MKLKVRKNIHILLTILKSRDSAAYYVILIKLLQYFLLPLDITFSLIEKLFLKKTFDATHPIVFVVGIHRSGSTVVSQVLAAALPFFPLGNFASIFPRSCFYIHKFAKVFYKPKPQRTYKNYYGISKGLFSVGDCYEVWDKWFGKDHYSIPDNISDDNITNMRNYFSYLQKAYINGIITKNNRNSLCFTLLNKIFPNAFFVIVRREATQVVQSTIFANKDFFGRREMMWGLKPNKMFNRDNFTTFVEAVCCQYLELEELIDEQIRRLENDSFVELSYEVFCQSPMMEIERVYELIARKFRLPHKNIKLDHGPLKASRKIRDKKLYNEIQDTLPKMRQKLFFQNIK